MDFQLIFLGGVVILFLAVLGWYVLKNVSLAHYYVAHLYNKFVPDVDIAKLSKEPRIVELQKFLFENSAALRREIIEIYLENKCVQMEELDEVHKKLMHESKFIGGWKTIWLRFIDENLEIVKESSFKTRFPICAEMFKLHGDKFFNCFISVLLPGAGIPEHIGPLKSVVKMHFPVQIPASQNLAPEKQNATLNIRDWNITYAWTHNHYLIFDDTKVHSVQNNWDKERIVLIFDIYRDLFLAKFLTRFAKFGAGYAHTLNKLNKT